MNGETSSLMNCNTNCTTTTNINSFTHQPERTNHSPACVHHLLGTACAAIITTISIHHT